MDPLSLPDDARKHSPDGLHPDARAEFDALLDEIRRRGWSVYISSAVRTFEEQSYTASKATRGCSWHQFGRALDLDINGSVAWNPETFGYLGEWWEARGPNHIWGGRWVNKYPPHGDFAHFQLSETGIPPEKLCGSRDAAAFRAYWSGVRGGGNGGNGASGGGALLLFGAAILAGLWLARD